eukprot:3618569-Amphidinium_carterae.2
MHQVVSVGGKRQRGPERASALRLPIPRPPLQSVRRGAIVLDATRMLQAALEQCNEDGQLAPLQVPEVWGAQPQNEQW